MTDQQRLEQLIRGGHPCVSIMTHEEDYALSLVRETAFKLGYDLSGSGLWLWSVSRGLYDGLVSGSQPIRETEHPAAALYYLARQNKRLLCATVDLMVHLRDERTLRQFRDLLCRFSEVQSHLITIDHLDDVPPVIAAHTTRFEISLPDEEELESLIRQTLRDINKQNRIEIEITRGGLKAITHNLLGLTRRQARQIITETVVEDSRFDASDINTVLAHKRRALHSGSLLEFVETPANLNDIGGLTRLKQWLEQRRGALSDDAVSFGLTPPRAILMLGVQGTGKSLCAKAVAAAWQRPLLRLDPGVLYDRYVGESEKRLRDALHQAERMAPIIFWIDEIEKGFASSASHSIDGGLSQRMFGTLLTWMQEHTAPVFLVATANNIDALPPELLRKGRFDEVFFIDLPTADVRQQIFSIHLKKRKRDPQRFDFDRLCQASEGYSGAEIEQAIVSALYEAFSAKKELDTETIVHSLRGSPPLSVIMGERIEALRLWAKGRCVPAG